MTTNREKAIEALRDADITLANDGEYLKARIKDALALLTEEPKGQEEERCGFSGCPYEEDRRWHFNRADVHSDQYGDHDPRGTLADCRRDNRWCHPWTPAPRPPERSEVSEPTRETEELPWCGFRMGDSICGAPRDHYWHSLHMHPFTPLRVPVPEGGKVVQWQHPNGGPWSDISRTPGEVVGDPNPGHYRQIVVTHRLVVKPAVPASAEWVGVR